MMKRTLHMVWIVVIVISALVSLATYGTTLPPSFTSSLPLDKPVATDSDGKHTVIADGAARRLLFLNSGDKLTSIVSFETLNAPIDVVTDAVVTGDSVYVSGLRYKPDSDVITNERILHYSVDGHYRGIVYETKTLFHYTPEIMKLCDTDEGVIAVESHYDLAGDDPIGKHIADFYRITPEGAQTLYTIPITTNALLDAGYSPALGGCYVALDNLGQLVEVKGEIDTGTYRFTAVDLDNHGKIYATDDKSGSVMVINLDGSTDTVLENAGRQSLHINGNVLTTCSNDRSTVTIYDLGTQDIRIHSEIYPARSLAALKGVVWFSRLVLAVSAVVFLVIKARNAYRKGHIDAIGPALAALAVLITVALAIVHLSYANYKSLLTVRASEISAYADYLSLQSSDLGKQLESLNDRYHLADEIKKDSSTDVGFLNCMHTVDRLVESASFNGIGLYYVFYGVDDLGIYYLYDSTLAHFMGSTVRQNLNNMYVSFAFKQPTPMFSGDLHTGSTLRDTTQYRLVSLPNSNGKVIGVIEIGSKQKSYASSIMGDLVSNVLGLLVMTLVVYLTYSELRACGRCYLLFQDMRDEHSHDAEALLTRPFSFFVTILTSIDSVMTVLIARSLATTAGLDAQGVYVAIPSVMLGVGLAMGQLVYGLLGTRLSLRQILRYGSSAMLVCATFAAFVVGISNYWLYCLAKMLMAIPFGLLYTTCYSMPRRARSDDWRIEAAGGIRRTDTSAAALGTVLGGYAAQVLGSAWVYVLVAVASIPIFIMASTMLHRHRHAPETHSSEEVAGPIGGLRFLTSRPTAALALLVILPLQLALGYNSFAFPLFSSDLGISSTAISNIVVLGQLAVYVSISTIERVQGRIGGWHLCFFALGLLGALFLLFSLNTTFVWATVVIALVGIFAKACDAWKGLWLRSADAVGMNAGKATGMMFATRSLALMAQPLVLSFLTTNLGNRNILVIGALCCICAFAFYRVTRETSIADS